MNSNRTTTPTKTTKKQTVLLVPADAWDTLHQSLVLDTESCAMRSAVLPKAVGVMKARRKSPRSQRSPRKRRSPIQRSANCVRLLALVRLFRLSPNQVAKAAGFSRPYVARLLSLKDDLTGSPEFFRALECKLGAIVENRTSQYFTIPAVSVRRVQGVLEQLPVEPVESTQNVERAVCQYRSKTL